MLGGIRTLWLYLQKKSNFIKMCTKMFTTAEILKKKHKPVLAKTKSLKANKK